MALLSKMISRHVLGQILWQIHLNMNILQHSLGSIIFFIGKRVRNRCVHSILESLFALHSVGRNIIVFFLKTHHSTHLHDFFPRFYQCLPIDDLSRVLIIECASRPVLHSHCLTISLTSFTNTVPVENWLLLRRICLSSRIQGLERLI